MTWKGIKSRNNDKTEHFKKNIIDYFSFSVKETKPPYFTL